MFERKLRKLQKIKFNLPRHTPMRFRYETHQNLCVHSTGYAANCPFTLKRLKELGMICYEGTNSVISTCTCQVNEASVFNPVPSLPHRAGRRNQRISGSIWLLVTGNPIFSDFQGQQFNSGKKIWEERRVQELD